MRLRYYRPRAEIQLDIPDINSTTSRLKTDSRRIIPIDLRWTKNNHLQADEMTVTVGWRDAGLDPRLLKQGRISMWLWDEERYPQPDPDEHLRFTGFVTKAARKLTERGWMIELTCRDYTTAFIDMKPFPESGVPDWNQTLREAWHRICDNTGYYNRLKNEVASSVAALKDNIEFIPPELESRTLGQSVSERFHAISKPAPKSGSDAWGVWQWVCAMSGLVTYIDRGRCVVTTTSEHFLENDAPLLIYGDNIDEFEEEANCDISNKGILVKSFDPFTGRLLESVYPPPDDQRIKKSRAVVKRSAKESRDPSLNEVSGDYDEFGAPWITDQKTLDEFTEQAYEQWSKQEMKGTLRTKEMFIYAGQESNIEIDTMMLEAGDCLYIGLHQETYDAIKHLESDEEKVAVLVERCGLHPETALVASRSLGDRALSSPIFHVETLEVELTPDTFDITIKFHNKVSLLKPDAAV